MNMRTRLRFYRGVNKSGNDTKTGRSEGINSLGEPNVDLERLVEEYRKSRKNLM